MRRSVGVLLGLTALGAMLIFASPAVAVTLSWNPVTTDNTGGTLPNPASVTYQVFTGTSSGGPWTASGGTTSATSATVADGAPGSTVWYTVDAIYETVSGAKAIPVSKAFVRFPAAPTGLTVQ